MRNISKLIVHCSATPNGRDVTVEQIRQWHLARDWDDIGYHYVIYRDGSVNAGRPVEKIGAHCYGENTGSIGVCLIGTDDFRPIQYNALRNLFNTLGNIYPGLKIFGHCDFTDKKTCPNFEVKGVLESL